VTLTRAKIRAPSVTLSWADGAEGRGPIALFTISSFSQDSAQRFSAFAQEALLRSPSALLVDVRNNSGGYLDQAVAIASAFIPDGPVVIEEFGDKQRRTYDARGSAPLKDFPVAVLLNGGSASASEILAGALRERRNAPLVGEPSFGKGSVQELEQLPGGAELKLTVARWLTPAGQSIEPDGLQPDAQIALTKDDYDNDRDPQRDHALDLVRQLP
jgi:carboxyl-terminal processing protease